MAIQNGKPSFKDSTILFQKRKYCTFCQFVDQYTGTNSNSLATHSINYHVEYRVYGHKFLIESAQLLLCSVLCNIVNIHFLGTRVSIHAITMGKVKKTKAHLKFNYNKDRKKNWKKAKGTPTIKWYVYI